MTHQSSLIIYKTDDSIVSSLPSFKCIFIKPFLRVILREGAWESILEKEEFPSLTSLPGASSGQRWELEGRGIGNEDRVVGMSLALVPLSCPRALHISLLMAGTLKGGLSLSPEGEGGVVLF